VLLGNTQHKQLAKNKMSDAQNIVAQHGKKQKQKQKNNNKQIMFHVAHPF
jgi:hypothetical protein